jgi:hypothetical protein
VSKPIRYDARLVHALAAELQQRYGGRLVRWIRFEHEQRTVVLNVGRQALRWELDVAGGRLVERPARAREPGLTLPRDTRVAAVRSPPDDRSLEWLLEAPGVDAPRRWQLRITLLSNRRNAVLMAGDRVLAELAPRSEPGGSDAAAQPRRAADRPLDADTFMRLLHGVPPAERERVLNAEVAWISSLNAAAILGEAAERADDDALRAAHNRYVMVAFGAVQPVLLDPDETAQPYPVPLPGASALPVPDLLAAFAARARVTAPPPDREAIVRALERKALTLQRRIARMRAEAEHATAEAAQARRNADLMLAQLSRLRKGMREVVLDDWSGGEVRVALDPALEPSANANLLYGVAKKRERAGRRLPPLIEQAASQRDRLLAAVERLRRGEMEVQEAAALLPATARPAAAGAPRRVALPYRRYRTAGGLEVRVGRGARANDELTLHHARPDDIWLHAREVAGAHVVLRWDSREENPPAADLVQAAILAAVHSRARTSGTVPVDWTRRKYVRKPRKAPPGQVLVERARTLFVQPDAGLAERLRME